MKRFYLILCYLISLPLAGQTVAPPVTAVVQTLPPFTANLSDWSDPINDKIGLTLLLNDRAEPGFQVHLRMVIEGQGIRLQTNNDWVPTPISLSYGIPAQLTGTDLVEYFDLDHLLFTGISREQYLSMGGLPEGTYSICFEVYDVLRDGPGSASQPACSFIQARLLDPPVILSPIGNQLALSPQQLLVQWQARHTASFLTNYKVEIYETQAGLTPEQIFALQQPYIEADVNGMTTLLIDAAYPSLRQGGNYFLRVQAQAPMGNGDFKNGGYSELVFFTFGEGCAPPEGLIANVESHDRARIQWDFRPGSASYVVRYRVKDPNAHWYEEATNANLLNLSNLNDATTYEVQVQSVCDGTTGTGSAIFEFTTETLSFNPSDVQCGDDVAAVPIPTNTRRTDQIGVGSRIQVGQFDLKISTVMKEGSGNWAGTGTIIVPWLQRKINCTFSDLGINTDLAVFSGEVVAIDKGLASLGDLDTPEDVLAEMSSAGADFCGSTQPPPTSSSDQQNALQRLGQGNITAGDASNVNAEGNSLPITLGSGTEQIAFYGMRFTAGGALMSAYSSARIPVGDRFVAFGAQNFGFQPGGMQGNNKLELLTDISFDWNGKMKFTLAGSEDTYVGFDCSGITEIGISMGIDFCRELIVPVDAATAEAAPTGYATATFTGVANSWSELSGEVNISPFELPQLPGWTFTTESAVLDFSDGSTPASVTFPENFSHPDVTSGTANGTASPNWKGFYLGLARVRIPEQFTGGQRDAGQAISIGASQLVIDQTGFSGSVFGTNVLTLEDGRAGAWALALDSIAIKVLHNQFESTNLAGLIEVPALDAPLAYNCHIQPEGVYAFTVAVKDDLTMDAMVANISLFENTEIGVEFDDATDSFKAYARLYGKASFAPSMGGSSGSSTGQRSGSKMELPGIAFEDFHLSSESPYIVNVGSWALAGAGEEEQPAVGGFPISLTEVSMLHDETRGQVAFGIGLTLNLVGDDDKGFGAKGRGFIICDVNVNPSTNKQEWSFNRVRLDRLSVDYVGTAFELHGFIQNFQDDPVYGTGFTGGIQAGFTPGISVGAMALFGKKDDYRYFFADAKVELNPGIALGQSGLAIFGFGGGVSYHMDRLGFDQLQPPVSEASEAGADAGAGQGTESSVGRTTLASALQSGEDPADAQPDPVQVPDELGVSLSGVRYIPDNTKSIGLKAMVAFGTVTREVFNGDLTLEVLFNTDGGMSKIALTGKGNFLTPPKTAANPAPVPAVSALADLTYDFENQAFDAYLRLTVYAAEGVLKGAYPNSIAGEGKIHASEEDWYIYLGTPTEPIKISYDPTTLANVAGETVGGGGNSNPHATNNTGSNPRDRPLGSIGDFGITMSAYLDAGSKLPAFPSPPENVREILGNSSDYNLTSRDDPAFANAEGVLFGASFELSMPDLRFLIFYASVEAGMGFDMMMKNYGTTAACANLADAPTPIGLNGWYGSGQIYGYLTADVGIEVDLLGYQGKYSILDVGVAALLEARLPNPMWMKGELAGEYSILGGLISGRCEFEFEAGSECNISPVGSLTNIEIIASLTPENEGTDISVFTSPQAIFNFPIDQEISFEDPSDPNASIKPVLNSFTVTDVASGATIPGNLEWNNDNTVAAFRPTDILPGNRQLRMMASVQVLKRAFGGWQQAMAGGRPVAQEMTYVFTTGEAPDIIAEENVRYAYPIKDQLNFHTQESAQGYLQLKQGQDYLFLGQAGNGLDASKWKQELRFHQNGRVVATLPFVYNGGANRLSFTLPTGQLTNGTEGYYQIVNLPTAANQSIDANIAAVDRDLEINYPDGQVPDENTTSVLIRSREATGQLTELKEKQLYRLDFRTSQYPTFPAKAAALVSQYAFTSIQALTTPPEAVVLPDGSIFTGPYLGIDDFGKAVSSPEAMDIFDVAGDKNGKDIDPLVRGEANLNVTASNWYRSQIKPNVYDKFPQPGLGINLDWRENAPYGEPPSKAIHIFDARANSLPKLGQPGNGTGPQEIALSYHLPYVMYRDYADYRSQVGGYSIRNTLTPSMRAFFEWDFTNPSSGYYEVQLQYYLPGSNTPNSSFTTQLPYNVTSLRK